MVIDRVIALHGAVLPAPGSRHGPRREPSVPAQVEFRPPELIGR
jgi:hypothetical protein